jgi:hypothetical protein
LPSNNIINRMKTILSSIFLIFSFIAKSQYYYDDIIDARELSSRMKTFVENKVMTISATGYDPQGAKTTDFNEWQEIDAADLTLKTSEINGRDVKKQYYRFDNQFRIISIVDSSALIKSTTIYKYDAGNRIVSINVSTNDKDSTFDNTEEHQWFYDNNGNPEKMWRIINTHDSAEFRFTIDEKGNVADEQLYRRGQGLDPVYYYYNDKNLLTDIVRYNKRAKRLLPDFMFEYDDEGRIIQKITVLSTMKSDYLIWRYLFNEKGLKTKEAMFNKEKQLRGRIEYTFTFSQ